MPPASLLTMGSKNLLLDLRVQFKDFIPGTAIVRNELSVHGVLVVFFNPFFVTEGDVVNHVKILSSLIIRQNLTTGISHYGGYLTSQVGKFTHVLINFDGRCVRFEFDTDYPLHGSSLMWSVGTIYDQHKDAEYKYRQQIAECFIFRFHCILSLKFEFGYTYRTIQMYYKFQFLHYFNNKYY